MSAVLCLDTSTFTAYVALGVQGKIVAELSGTQHGSVECLTELVRGALSEGRVELAELSEIIVCVGPGSFTGLRTGIAAAQGLGAALALPVTGVSALLARALLNADEKERLLVATRSSRGESFVCAFEKQDAFTLGVLSPVLAVKDELLEAAPEAVFPESPEWGNLRLVRFEPEDGNQAALLCPMREVNVLGHRGLHYQTTDRGKGLDALYAKPAAAKTIEERRAEAK